MKKLGLFFYIILAYILFFSSCSPKIQFTGSPPGSRNYKIFIKNVVDLRPVNEKTGYSIFYIKSISDDDYEKDFLTEFKQGIYKKISESFTIVTEQQDADTVLNISVNHFYGEYSRTVKTVIWEYGTIILLFIPRLITDAFHYNSFAGRVAMEFVFITKDGRNITKSLDIKVKDKVSTYKRGSASTVSLLGKVASPEIDTIMRGAIDEI
jgi:hypothetical protein